MGAAPVAPPPLLLALGWFDLRHVVHVRLGLRHLAHVRVHAVRVRRVALARGGTATAHGGDRSRCTRPVLTRGESAARGGGARSGHVDRVPFGWLCGSRAVPGIGVCLH
eukprot:830690-Prymnesium_polylepis.1